jgi:hypothetical protein
MRLVRLGIALAMWFVQAMELIAMMTTYAGKHIEFYRIH